MTTSMAMQMGGSGGQQGYGSSSYQQLSAAGQYGAGAVQSAYGAAQPAAQSYTPSQTYAQQSPAVGTFSCDLYWKDFGYVSQRNPS